MADDDEDALIDRVEDAERNLRRMALRTAPTGELLNAGLSIQQIRLLLYIWVNGECSSHEIAETFVVRFSTVTGTVDRLENRGLVRRRPDPDDRRIRRIGLTDAGQRLLTRFDSEISGYRRRLLRRLEPRVLANLAEALEALEREFGAEVGAEVDAEVDAGTDTGTDVGTDVGTDASELPRH